MERQGYHATGLNQIIEASQTPKGSLYHYFPGGKEELAVEALRLAAADLGAKIRFAVDNSPNAIGALRMMGAYMITRLQNSSFSEACPIATVALETAHDSEHLQAACSEAYYGMQSIIHDALIQDGFTPEQAGPLASLVVCSHLGSLLLSRTHQTTTPIETMVEALASLWPTGQPAT
jgi:TetR/AcrR family transcriptional repressor of lmrAB and yxaGH operons